MVLFEFSELSIAFIHTEHDWLNDRLIVIVDNEGSFQSVPNNTLRIHDSSLHVATILSHKYTSSPFLLRTSGLVIVIPDKNSGFISIVGFLSSGLSHATTSSPAVHNAIAGIIGHQREVTIHTLAIALLTALLRFHDLLPPWETDSLVHSFKANCFCLDSDMIYLT